jgi:Tfp pilus assembly protein PilV
MRKTSKNQSKRGITLFETVISIAIISAVVAAVLMLMASQAKMRKSTVESLRATSIAECALECYAHSGGESFAELLAATLGIDKGEIGFEKAINVGGMTLEMRKNDSLIDVRVSKNGKTVVEVRGNEK